ncbi:hypothetical protein GGS24DRAFT_506774 [Hypoxylon argillaceum]|nr:hypothetical protein GGS24DRAFT_506774 [Hypoxylon argillaceum]
MKAFFLIPASLASLVLAYAASPPSVYILMPSDPALTALSSALNTLGYRHSASIGSSGAPDLGLDPRTFAVLEPGAAYRNISRDNPGTRFILPAGAAAAADDAYYSWLRVFSQGRQGRAKDGPSDSAAVRAFSAEMEKEDAGGRGASWFLELDVFARDQAQIWVELCDFLGLGYSVVERLRLWRFPQ